MRLVFMGTPAFACPTLELLLSSHHEVLAVFTQPDKPAGRGQRLTPPPVKGLALKAGLPVLQPPRLRSEQLSPYAADAVVVAAYGKFLPSKVLDLPRHGCINLHPSLLPKYRGAAPVNWAILRGEEVTGVTTMFISEEMDAGPILLQEATAIGPRETAWELSERLARMGAELMLKTLEGLEAGTLKPRAQDHEAATFAPKLKKEDGLIDWQKGAHEISRLVRGMCPWPGAHTSFRGKTLKLWAVEPLPEDAPGAKCGELILRGRGALAVATGEGLLLIEEIQPEGGKRMSARAFLAGHRLKEGERLG